jgi:hypothetical protein
MQYIFGTINGAGRLEASLLLVLVEVRPLRAAPRRPHLPLQSPGKPGNPPATGGKPRYSTRAPEAFTTCAHLVYSDSI